MSLSQLEKIKADRKRKEKWEIEKKQLKAEGRLAKLKVSDTLEESESLLKNFVTKNYKTEDLARLKGQLLRNLIGKSNMKIIAKLTENAETYVRTLDDCSKFKTITRFLSDTIPLKPHIHEISLELKDPMEWQAPFLYSLVHIQHGSKKSILQNKIFEYLIRYSYLILRIFDELSLKTPDAMRIFLDLIKYPKRINTVVTIQNIVSIYRFHAKMASKIPAIRSNLALDAKNTLTYITQDRNKLHNTQLRNRYYWDVIPPYIYFKMPVLYDLSVLPRNVQYRMYHIAKTSPNLPLSISDIILGNDELNKEYAEEKINYEFPIPIGPELLLWGIKSFKKHKPEKNNAGSILAGPILAENYGMIKYRKIYDPQVFRIICELTYGPDYKKSRIPPNDIFHTGT